MIVAIVRPEKYDEVKDALKEKGVLGMTFTHVTGRGLQAGVRFTNRVGEFTVDEIEKMKIEIVVEDDSKVPCIIETICRVAGTGRHGDGRIFVVPVEQALRISDWELGSADPSGDQTAQLSEEGSSTQVRV